MPLTARESKVLQEIREWEKQLYSYEANDFQLTYEKYMERSFSILPEKVQQQFFSVIDSWLFYIHSMIQGSQLQMDAKERILSAGRIFQQDVDKIADLKRLGIDKLEYIAEQQISRHRFYSFAQGGLSGSGGPLLLGVDIPAIALINLRVVQLIAFAYGNDVNTPYEMVTSLKVFHAGTLPLRLQKESWDSLNTELSHYSSGNYFYEGKEEMTNLTWLEQPLTQLLKAMVIALFRKKVIQGIPLISMAIGAGANYQLTRKVTELAHNYYQLRYLKEKEELLHE